jgi:hypothetical protein
MEGRQEGRNMNDWQRIRMMSDYQLEDLLREIERDRIARSAEVDDGDVKAARRDVAVLLSGSLGMMVASGLVMFFM